MAQYAIAFSILQIGELVAKLSEELRSATRNEIDRPAFKGMRNIIAHDYGASTFSGLTTIQLCFQLPASALAGTFWYPENHCLGEWFKRSHMQDGMVPPLYL